MIAWELVLILDGLGHRILSLVWERTEVGVICHCSATSVAILFVLDRLDQGPSITWLNEGIRLNCGLATIEIAKVL